MKLKKVFNCQRCGACCQGRGGIYIHAADAEEIGKVLDLTPAQFIQRYTEPKGELLSLKTGPDGFCVMYDAETRGCRIHRVKPVMCQVWPFYPAPLRYPEEFEIVKNNCPGINRDTDWAGFVAYYQAHQESFPSASDLFKPPGPGKS
ncbi:MAG: YkgJ family cysteine cluster protein [Deltaproteobacteria bacterium]|nr:YkgJ family cysteine cluster protein [Deltaproteobacteria bacterium]MBW2085143.1 YkgJ family cysteine cluster protein [Deltaproteobacteria bacterium]